MPPSRLSRAVLADHLILESPGTRRLVLGLRAVVLECVPEAAEAIKFRVLCYFHTDAWFGAIGGNICMIEAKRGRVWLSFIHGAALPDPEGLLTGSGKFKRFFEVRSVDDASRPGVRNLLRAAADLRPWD